MATGYITIDVVRQCSQLTPADPGYFVSGGRGVASNDNAIWGEFFLVHPGQDLAQGEAAVHLVADADKFSGGPTFYQRYVGAGGRDNRQPLGQRYGVRFANGGVFDGATQLLVWRDTGVRDARPMPCGQQPAWAPLPMQDGLVFDEEENSTLLGASSMHLPVAAQEVHLGTSALPVSTLFGWMILDFQVPAGTPTPDYTQAWIVPVMSAQNRFSVSFRPVRLDPECGY